MVMVVPPYHSATIRASEEKVFGFYAGVSDAIDISTMIQDAPVSGTTPGAAFLARMAWEIAQVSYFKIETAGAASELRELIRLGGDAVEGPWDSEEAIALLPDLDAGATGGMTGGAYSDGIRIIMGAYVSGPKREEAVAQYQRWLPLINDEKRQGGTIACDAPRYPFPAMHPALRTGLPETARRLDPACPALGK